MNRSTFLQRLGLGALAGLVPWRAKAEAPDSTRVVDGMSAVLNSPEGLAEALGEYRAPSWRMEGDWTVVYAPTIIRPDEAFEPHLLVPGCPKSFLVGASPGLVIVDADGVRVDRPVISVHTATDTLEVIAGEEPFTYRTEAVRGPFWLFWPDEWVVLASTGAVGSPVPFEFRTGPASGQTLPRHRSGLRHGWRSIGVDDLVGGMEPGPIRVHRLSSITA